LIVPPPNRWVPRRPVGRGTELVRTGRSTTFALAWFGGQIVIG
jgi:hypothetical protein